MENLYQVSQPPGNGKTTLGIDIQNKNDVLATLEALDAINISRTEIFLGDAGKPFASFRFTVPDGTVVNTMERLEQAATEKGAPIRAAYPAG